MENTVTCKWLVAEIQMWDTWLGLIPIEIDACDTGLQVARPPKSIFASEIAKFSIVNRSDCVLILTLFRPAWHKI